MDKPSSFSNLITQLVPDQIEKTWNDVDDYLSGQAMTRAKTLGDDSAQLRSLMNEAVDKFGDPVRNALYGVLCDKDNPLHAMAKGAVGKGTTQAVAALMPALAAQFAIGGIALPLVAVLIVHFLSSKAGDKFCDELEPDKKPAKKKEKDKEKPAAKPKPGTSKPKKPASGSTAKPKPKPKQSASSSGSSSTTHKPAARPKPKPSSSKPKKPASSTTSGSASHKPASKPKSDDDKPKKPRTSSSKLKTSSSAGRKKTSTIEE